jgi:hypothetical protein
MLDDATTEGATKPRCMWCSAELPSDHETVCPSCGATLIGDNETQQVPGVTAIDAEALISGRTVKPRQRSRLLSWISGEYDGPEEAPSPPGSLAPPPPAVRREMLRLELEAQVANLQAEAGAMAAEEAVEAGTAIAETETGAALAAVNVASRSESARAATAADEATADEGPGIPPPPEPAASVAEDLPPA